MPTHWFTTVGLEQRAVRQAEAVRDLQRFDYFHSHTEKQLSAVALVARPRRLGVGEVLYKQGESDGSSCFFLWSGCLALHCKNEAHNRLQAHSLASAVEVAGAVEEEHEQEPARQDQRPQELELDSQQDAEEHNEAGKQNTPAHRRPNAPARLGGTRAYVGMYVQKKFVQVHESPDDHGALLYRRVTGSTVGALSALTGCKRYESAVAEAESTLLEVRSEDYKKWLASKDEKAYAADCLFLRETPCFQRLPDNALVKIAASFQRKSHPSKVDVCMQGTTEVAIHIIRSGECELVRRVKMPNPDLGRAAERCHCKLHLADLGRTDIIGHHEVLSKTKHSFSASTKNDVELWSLSSDVLHELAEQFAKQYGAELKKLIQELLEHGSRQAKYHKQRALETGAARFDPREQEKKARFAIKQEMQTPQWKAAEAAAARARRENERVAGDFRSAIEVGPSIVGKVLNQKFYTRVRELQPRIHPLLLQPLDVADKKLPLVLSKRKKMYDTPIKVDLTAGTTSTPQWLQQMDFEEPFQVTVHKLSKRDQLIHDQINYAVNMFETYAALAQGRLRRAEQLARRDGAHSPTRIAQTCHTSQPRATKTAKTGASARAHSLVGGHGNSAQWIDMQGFLSLLQGAALTLHRPHSSSHERELQDSFPPQSDLPAVLPALHDTHTHTHTQAATVHTPNLHTQSAETRVQEKVAIRLFLASARRSRDSLTAPERCISFQHFLACLGAICSQLNCSPPATLQDPPHSPSETQVSRTRAYTSMSMHTECGAREEVEGLPTISWQSPMIVRQRMMMQHARRCGGARYASDKCVRHHGVKLRRVLQPSTPLLNTPAPADTRFAAAHPESPLKQHNSATPHVHLQPLHHQMQALRKQTQTPPVLSISLTPPTDKNAGLAAPVAFRSSEIIRCAFFLLRAFALCFVSVWVCVCV